MIVIPPKPIKRFDESLTRRILVARRTCVFRGHIYSQSTNRKRVRTQRISMSLTSDFEQNLVRVSAIKEYIQMHLFIHFHRGDLLKHVLSRLVLDVE
jgi:hypothetical protein